MACLVRLARDLVRDLARDSVRYLVGLERNSSDSHSVSIVC